MLETIKEILSKNLRKDASEINENTNIRDDLGADSLDTVNIIMELETAFGVSITDDDAKALKTVKDIMDFIEAHKS